MVEAGTERDPAAPPPEDDDARAQLVAIAERSVARLVRREFAAIFGGSGRKGAATRYADNPKGWEKWLARFYREHAALVAHDLGLPGDAALAYCGIQRERFVQLANVTESAETLSVETLMQTMEKSHEPE